MISDERIREIANKYWYVPSYQLSTQGSLERFVMAIHEALREQETPEGQTHDDSAAIKFMQESAAPTQRVVPVEPVAWRYELGMTVQYSTTKRELKDWEETPLYAHPTSTFRRAIERVLACYSPDDSATDWADKIRALTED